MLKKSLSIAILSLSVLASSVLAGTNPTTLQTNVDVIGRNKDMYGQTSTGVAKQLIGINSSGKVSIDEGAVGTVFGAGLTQSTGDLAVSAGDVNVNSSVTVKPIVNIKNTNADATAGYLKLEKDSDSPANSDVLGTITVYGNDSITTDATEEMARIQVKVEDITTASEDSSITLSTQKAGTLTTTLTLKSGVVQIPDGTAAVPAIQFASDTDTGIYSSAANKVGINSAGMEVLNISNTYGLAFPRTPTLSFLVAPSRPGSADVSANMGVTVNIGGSQYLLLMRKL